MIDGNFHFDNKMGRLGERNRQSYQFNLKVKTIATVRETSRARKWGRYAARQITRHWRGP